MLLKDPKAHPLALGLYLTKILSPKWLDWEPETIRAEAKRKGRSAIAPINWQKIMAFWALSNNPDHVLSKWEAFLPVLLAFNNTEPDADTMIMPSLAQMTAGVPMILSLTTAEEPEDEVKRFLVAALHTQGQYFVPPEELGFLQWLARDPYYVCASCGNRERLVEDHDGVCDYCGRDWFAQASGKPVRTGKPRYGFRFDVGPCLALLKEVASGKEPEWDDEKEAHVQVVRVLDALAYKAKLDARFLEQKERWKL